MGRILAFGGGGFMMEDGISAIDAHLVSLTGKTAPRVCFVSTASGDLPLHLEKFHTAYTYLGSKTSHLAFFRQSSEHSIPLADIGTRLFEQDAIFVGGGNAKSALAVWREWGLDVLLG